MQKSTPGYLKNISERSFSGLLSCTTPPISEHFIETTCTGSAEALLSILLPCVGCDSEHWVNWWSPPPGSDSNYPALIHNKLGAGSCYYMAFDFFTMVSLETFQYPHDLFYDLITSEQIQPEIQNKTETPDIIRTAYFETADSYIVHQISMIPKQFHGDVFPISGGILELNVPVSEAKLVYPEEQTLEVHSEEKRTRINLPEFTLQQIIVCKK